MLHWSSHWGTPIDGLRSSLKLDKKIYRLGEDPILTFSLQAVAEEPLAAVPPTTAKDSDFPELLTLDFTRVRSDGKPSGFFARIRSGRVTLPPGANEYSFMPQHKVYSAKFPVSSLEKIPPVTLDSLGESMKLAPGQYEVVAEYFIRVTTPKFSQHRIDEGPVIRLRDHGARMWSGYHLKSNTARFTVKKAEEAPKK